MGACYSKKYFSESIVDVALRACEDQKLPPPVTSTRARGNHATALTESKIAKKKSFTLLDSTKMYRCNVPASRTLPRTLSTSGVAFKELYGCHGLNSITLPNSLTEIGPYAFCARHELTSVDLPNTLTTIGSCAFKNCDRLLSITLPNGLTRVGDGAFSGCTGLTSVTFPDSISYISSDAFNHCPRLTSLTLPESLTGIGAYAFNGCSGLTSLSLPNTLITIGPCAFAKCSGITSLTLPNSTKIGLRSFQGCTGLTSIIFRPRLSSIFIAWAVGRMRNRANWRLTTVKRLRNVLRLITALAFEQRDMSTVDVFHGKFGFQGCTGLTLSK